MTIFDTWLHSDLQRPLTVTLLPGVFFAGDDQANRLNVRVTDDGRSASLAGTVTAYLIRSDESTLIVSGTLAGDTASILLPEAAYAKPGPLDIVIKLISGDQRTAIGACRAYVARTSTDAIVDPGHVIPSLDELLALIERMEADMALVEGMTATAHGLDTLQPPTVTVTREDGHFHLDFGIPKGATGEGGVSSVNGYAPDSQGNVTIPTATAAADGLLSAGDKDKLSNLSFPLPVNKGGTGRDFFTYGEVLMGNNAGRLLTKPITDISQDGDIGATLNLVNARTLVHYANYRLGDYLPLTGGTLTGDLIIDAHSLVINGAWYPHMQLKATQDGSTNEGRVEASHYGRLSLQSWNDETGDDRRVLDILNSSTGAPLAESLILREIVDGNNGTEYRVITSAGGTVNGALEFTTPAASGAEMITFSQSAGFTELAICKSDDGTTRKRFAFRQYRPSGTYSETYVLPSTTNDITASANYDILTSKSAVTVAQGGTGATSLASGAALIGNGTNAVTTRAITNLTSDGTVTADANLITANTLVHYANNRLGNYLPLTGGTMTGPLGLGSIAYYDTTQYPSLDDMHNSGLWQFAGGTTGAPFINPGFVLVVWSTNTRATQFAWRSTNANVKTVYMRKYDTSVWGDWTVVADANLLSWKSTTTWSTAVADAKADIKVVFEYVDGSYTNIFTIDIPVAELTTSNRFFYGTTHAKAGTIDKLYYYQIQARTTSYNYADLYVNGTKVTADASIRFLYR